MPIARFYFTCLVHILFTSSRFFWFWTKPGCSLRSYLLHVVSWTILFCLFVHQLSFTFTISFSFSMFKAEIAKIIVAGIAVIEGKLCRGVSTFSQCPFASSWLRFTLVYIWWYKASLPLQKHHTTSALWLCRHVRRKINAHFRLQNGCQVNISKVVLGVWNFGYEYYKCLN